MWMCIAWMTISTGDECISAVLWECECAHLWLAAWTCHIKTVVKLWNKWQNGINWVEECCQQNRFACMGPECCSGTSCLVVLRRSFCVFVGWDKARAFLSQKGCFFANFAKITDLSKIMCQSLRDFIDQEMHDEKPRWLVQFTSLCKKKQRTGKLHCPNTMHTCP